MTMPPRLHKFALVVHVTSSVGLLGAIAAFLALSIAGLIAQDASTIRVVYPAMQMIARLMIVPLAAATLLTGLIQSLGTPWGLFRYYWVLVKLLLTIFATTVLLLKIEIIDHAARLASETALSSSLRVVGIQLVVHAAGSLLLLIAPVALSIYKPPGLTRYGWRKQLEQHLPS